MEILAVEPCMTMPWWIGLFIVIGVLSALAAVILLAESEFSLSFATALSTLICIALIFILGPSAPTGKYKYTVEITDSSYYQILIDKNYSLSKLYENKNIYEIMGDELNESYCTSNGNGKNEGIN